MRKTFLTIISLIFLFPIAANGMVFLEQSNPNVMSVSWKTGGGKNISLNANSQGYNEKWEEGKFVSLLNNTLSPSSEIITFSGLRDRLNKDWPVIVDIDPHPKRESLILIDSVTDNIVRYKFKRNNIVYTANMSLGDFMTRWRGQTGWSTGGICYDVWGGKLFFPKDSNDWTVDLIGNKTLKGITGPHDSITIFDDSDKGKIWKLNMGTEVGIVDNFFSIGFDERKIEEIKDRISISGNAIGMVVKNSSDKEIHLRFSVIGRPPYLSPGNEIGISIEPGKWTTIHLPIWHLGVDKEEDLKRISMLVSNVPGSLLIDEVFLE